MDETVRHGRLSRVPWRRIDEVCAVGYALPLAMLLAKYSTGPAAVLGILAGLIAFAAPIALRRRWPLIAAALPLCGAMVVRVVEPRLLAAAVPALLAVLYLAATRLRPASWLLLGAALLTLPSPYQRGGILTLGLCYVTAFAIGAAVGGQRRATDRALTAQARGGEMKLAQARAGVAEERLRIARELHDVIAHGLSVITVQAGFAQLVMQQDAKRAQTALAAIEETGRDVLGELRAMLGVLRTADGLTGETTPAPVLAELPELIERTALAGVAVQLSITGRHRTLPAGVELCAYRIVQEALTNVVKHAGTATATALLHYGADEVTVQIRDTGHGATPGPDGHGLLGMRERVRSYGGSLTTGSGPGGGFDVTACIPISTHPEPAPVAVPA